jgi:hypothetical protein
MRMSGMARYMLGAWPVLWLGLWVPVLAVGFWLGLVNCVLFWALGVLAGALFCGLVPLCGRVVFTGGRVVVVLPCVVVEFMGGCAVFCGVVAFMGVWLFGWVLFCGAVGFGFSSRYRFGLT